jgi:hypothetical protein
MWLTLDDLRCPQCGASVHPLLEACPACGAARLSRRDEAAAGPIGAVRLAEAPETQRVARNLAIRYTMKVNTIGNSAADATLVDAVAHVADALTYRMTGDAIPTTDDAALTLREGTLIAQGRPSGALLAEIPLRAIVGTAARHGEATLHYAAGLVTGIASGPGGPAGGPGPLRLTVGNRRGLLASKARDDHYEALAHWLGVLAAAAAERRWTEIGLPAYLAELEQGAAGPVASAAIAAGVPRIAGDALVAVPGGLPVIAAPSVQASLVELESLRAAGLIAEGEYAEKRREILARL